MIEEDQAGLIPHQNIVPNPKELSLLSHEELLPLLEKLVGYSMESFTKQPSSDGKYPKQTLTGSVLAYFLDWYAYQLFQKVSYNLLFRNLKDSLLELCTDLDSIACEKLIWWLEETYVNYISETLNKILVGADIENEIAAVNLLNEKPCPTLVPTRVRSVKLEGHSSRTFQSLVMPHYPCSLDKLTKLLNDEDILGGGKRMLAALEFIHSRNMVHMDIKPANIFVSTEGDWFLGDFGSCVEYNDVIRSCSESYLPKKVIGKRAEYGYDFFMLAISLLSLKVELQTMFLNNTKLIDDNKVIKIVSELEHNELQFLIHSLLEKSKTAVDR